MLDIATVQSDAVAHRHLIFQNRGVFASPGMDPASVLNVRPIAHAYVVHVASQHRVAPDRRLLPDMNVADNLRALINVSRRVDSGLVLAESSNHFRGIV